MTLDNSIIQNRLEQHFGGSVKDFKITHDILSLEVDSEYSHAVISFLKTTPELDFHFMTDLCGVHYPDNKETKQFAVVYHLHNWIANIRIRITVYLSGNNPTITSVTDLFKSANWQERETYDFYGIQFKNHPQMKRILNMDEMESFPLRKEFPMEDSGRTDKDDRFFGRSIHNC